ncbi:MAG: HAD-IA family hydrolase [Chitinivibrionales bacterium]|nr:HAD-IA family hydrolase [Chitinivibrionales bacterium]MBD3394308.1 HAD-IA family hydrolase [Chitinivibrionales bacterium]
MRFRAVVFDVDGTLLNTLDDLADSMNAVLAAMSFPQHATDDYRYFVGDGFVNLARRALPKGARDRGTVQECVTRVREEYRKNWKNKTRPYYGIPKVLNWLKDNGIQSAVLSNKDEEFTRTAVTTLLPHWNFVSIRGATDDLPLKPDPKAASLVAKELGRAPSKILYVGDTKTDMKTAVAAKMYPCGALWGFRTREELEKAGAKEVFEKPLDVIRFLEKK